MRRTVRKIEHGSNDGFPGCRSNRCSDHYFENGSFDS